MPWINPSLHVPELYNGYSIRPFVQLFFASVTNFAQCCYHATKDKRLIHRNVTLNVGHKTASTLFSIFTTMTQKMVNISV